MRNKCSTLVGCLWALGWAGPALADDPVVVPPEDFLQECVPPEDVTAGRCVPFDAPMGDFELLADRGSVLLATNVGGDEEAWPAVGTHPVRLLRLDPTTGLMVGSVRLATDYAGSSTVNGPEFLRMPDTDPNELGVLYRAADGIRVVWRARGAPWNVFSAPEPLPYAPAGAYPAFGFPEKLGVCSAYYPPPDSPDYADCPMGCDLDLLTGVVTPVVSELTELGNSIRAHAHHPLDPDRWAVTGCDRRGKCGLAVGLSDGAGGLDLSHPILSPLFTPKNEATSLRGAVHPDTGAVLWFTADSKNRTRIFEEGTAGLREVTSPSYGGGYAPLPANGPVIHYEVTSGDGKLLLYYQIRRTGGDADGTWTVSVDWDGSRYVLEGPTKVAACAESVELAWLEGAQAWATYELSKTAEGVVTLYRCWAP